MRALALLLWLGAPLAARADIFSPGDLARPHAELDGLANCTLCHPAGKQLSQESCLACHTELKPSITKGSGFHGRIATADRNCEKCHHEHQGASLQLINWGTGGKKGFNHSRTGWPLTGAHSPLECGKCHEKRRISAAPILAFLEKHPAQETFLGLPNPCVGCHFDEHRDQVGQQCQSCHITKAWKPAPQFDHAKTDYPLTGKHRKVACDKCHARVRDEQTAKTVFPAPVSETFLKYAPLEFKACTSCHKDVHEGRFGPKCASCHSTEAWSVIRNASQERAFHEKTRFPLKGEHLEVECRACHGPFPGQAAKFKGLAHDDCGDCHPDAHEGQLKAAAGRAGPDCESCHSVDGFLPVRFGLTQHQKTRYPLDAAHAVVGCLRCHPRQASLADKVPLPVRAELKRKKRPALFSLVAIDFKGALERCDSCHGDVHQGQLKDKPCASCHQPASFSRLTFDHAKDSRYPLTGKHAEVACDKCHAPDKKGGPVKYRGLALTCAGCHADAHAGQLERAGKTECERCHSTAAFKPASAFRHEPPFTDYLLEGKHAQVACEACHKKVELKARVVVQRFKPLARECEGCHSDFHNGAFTGFEP
ncbi:MAG: hypothetical protein IPJ65_20115 [Archangiaceae bacterium]|nr:hypothetical protein [Archangiaceae bacterium]